MCGSGTLLIEAALIIGDVAPGLDRRYFGFLKWRGHNKEIWQQLVDEALEREESGLEKPWPRLLGFDSNPGVIKGALTNISQADLNGKIHVERRDLARLQPPTGLAKGRHFMITNPPYGERLSEKEEVKFLYRYLGRVAATFFSSWHLAVFSSNPDLLDALAQKTIGQYRFYNGPIACTLRIYEVASHEQQQHTWHINSDSPSSTLANRLKKNLKPLLKWASREQVSCFRIYDRDIPEYNVAIDLFGPWVHIQEYPAPATIAEDKVRARRKEVIETVSQILECKRNRIFIKSKSKQQGKKHGNKKPPKDRLVEVKEGGCRFLVNLSQYPDGGFYLGHRILRGRIHELAAGKRFLNLFSYTGAATVHAAMAGARTTTSIDTSRTFLDWTRKNLSLNGFDPSLHTLERADCLKWLQGRKVERYDLILVDPPSFSNTKRGGGAVFDLQPDHEKLIDTAMGLLEKGGLLLFTTSLGKFSMAEGLLERFDIRDISSKSIPQDFSRKKKALRAFEIRHRD